MGFSRDLTLPGLNQREFERSKWIVEEYTVWAASRVLLNRPIHWHRDIGDGLCSYLPPRPSLHEKKIFFPLIPRKSAVWNRLQNWKAPQGARLQLFLSSSFYYYSSRPPSPSLERERNFDCVMRHVPCIRPTQDLIVFSPYALAEKFETTKEDGWKKRREFRGVEKKGTHKRSGASKDEWRAHWLKPGLHAPREPAKAIRLKE